MQGNKQVVLLTGASGSMGFETFKLLWEKRDRFDIVLLLRPSRKNRRKFSRYLRKACAEGEGSGPLRIVWGDALNLEDVVEACRGIDWCLHTMALISPEADRRPEMAELVNARGTRYLVEAIEAEDPEHIRLVSVGSVAMYGDRLPPLHVGRTGDPLVPSIFDRYALSKIRGELSVMQSRIKHRVSLRQTFIMIPDLFSLMDPIMFHQPLNSFMENITAKDAGRLMVSCLEVPEDSGFWGEYYNISGGPGCRITYLEFLDRIYGMLGIRCRRVMERNWFALKNFHMQFFEDADRLDAFLHHWVGGQTMEDYLKEVWKQLPRYLKVTARFAGYIPLFRLIVEAATRRQLKCLARRPGGTLHWLNHNDMEHIRAFFGSMEAYRSIPGWDPPGPSREPGPDHGMEYIRLDHGYDETKLNPGRDAAGTGSTSDGPGGELDLSDLQEAARFRGGQADTAKWDGNMHTALPWRCCQGHLFTMTPHAVLEGGHWCTECIAPPWNYSAWKDRNLFAKQVLSR